jgi:ketosteroid isomerase-like protein
MKLPARPPWIFLAIALAMAAPTIGWAHQPPPAVGAASAKLSGDAADAAAVVDAFHAALKAGDIPKAASLVAEDALVFEAGGAERSKAEYAASHLPADAAFEASATETVTRRSGATSGDLAWVATEGRVQARLGQKVVDRVTTETMVLSRTSAGWRIVHVHWSSRAAPSGS